MTALAKHLARDLPLELNCRIAAARFTDNQWELTDSNGNPHGPYDVLVSAMPHDQFIQLFADYLDAHEAVMNVRMSGCFSLMIGCEDIPLPDFTIARVTGSSIGLLVNNSRKPSRDTANSLLIHSTNQWAEENINEELESVRDALVEEVSKLLDTNYSSTDYLTLHRWRYAQVEVAYQKPFYQHDSLPLFACGDWCLGPRVECAYISGHKTGTYIQENVS